LEHRQPAVFQIDAVGEGAAGVDGNAHGSGKREYRSTTEFSRLVLTTKATTCAMAVVCCHNLRYIPLSS
ncbi:MAG TPA: hypothetical protein VGU90_02495, partial [Terriglobales bacterium]|nr:hypothetical protein [Terriglobales bacterium]